MSSLASVYARRGSIYVAPSSKTEAGFWVEHGPYFAEAEADARAEPMTLARHVLAALAASRVGMPTPPRDELRSRLPEFAGVKSYATFMRGAQLVTVSRENETITLTPTSNGGARTGFTPLVDEVVRVDSPDQLGSCLLGLLDRAPD